MESKLKTSYMRFVGEINEMLAPFDCNCVYSPLSIYVALSILETISRDGSQAKITLAETLGLDDDVLLELRETISQLQDDVFKCANCVGVSPVAKGYVNNEHLEKMKADFDVTVFDNKDFIPKINGFIKKVTKGMIVDAIANDPLDNFVLANAVCFVDEWKEAYKADRIDENGSFLNYLGKEETVTMMHSEEKYGIKGSNFTGLCKPYKNGNYEFMALLPDDEHTDIVEFFDEYAGRLAEIYAKKKRIKVYAEIPCFRVESEFELRGIIDMMGIDLTSENDFIRLFDGYLNNVDSIFHKALIEVDDKGTKAAAVTVIMMKASAMPFREESLVVSLDRPFIYAIMSKKTGLPIFVGMYSKVN